MKRGLLFVVLACLPLGVMAEKVWVNDIIYLGIRPSPDQGKPVAVVKSGTELEVVERQRRYVKVRTPDGVEGWVSATYVSEEPTARERLAELQSRYDKLEETLQAARDELAGANEANTRVSANLLEASGARDELQARIKNLESQLEALRPKPENPDAVLRERLLIAGGGVAALIAVFFAGAAWCRSRITRRLGGLRI